MAGIHTLGDVAQTELVRLQANLGPTGLPTGLGLERRVPGGIPVDKVTTLFAEAGSYKTTIKNHLLISMAEAGHRVLDVSLEDSKELSAHRYLARLSGLPYGHISGGVLSPAQLAEIDVSKAAKAVADRVLMADDIDPTADTIFRTAYECRQANGLSAVAIDYVQLLAGPGGLKERLDDLMVKAQRFSKKHKMAVILVSQQKQASERGDQKDDPRPELGDMLGSSAMRIGSKLVVALFNPASYSKAPTSLKGPYGMYARMMTANPANVDVYPELVEAWVLKNVMGPQGAMHLRVNRETGVVANVDDFMRPYL